MSMNIRHIRHVRRTLARPTAAFLLCAAVLPLAVACGQAGRGLPDHLSDADFWKLETDISEPSAYFRIADNFTSNEMEVGELFTMLRTAHTAGDVYLGVGPEQNFSYIASVRPRMAFICDIRRQAVVQHLMFKVIFEMARDRAEFISLLFALPRPNGLDTATAIQKIWDAYAPVHSDSALAAKTYARIAESILHTHKFTLSADETTQLKDVYDAFVRYGPGITTQSGSRGGGFGGGFGGGGRRGGGGGGGGRASGTFRTLTGYSLDADNQPRSFLSSEDNYQYLKTLEEKNLIVPVSGDFGGTKALRAIGAYLKDHEAIVRAFYVSNVEQYLFMDNKQKAFYDNVAALPLDATSVFIRPYSMRRGGGAARSLCPIAAFLRQVNAGRVNSNNEAVACAYN